jgi:uncharacterized protein YndB with AHSA1/START domain
VNGDVVTVERTISAPPDRIFELLADPRRHRDIDGSGTVQEAKSEAPQRLSLGSKFGMSMRLGLPYSMVNEVVEFQENRRIAWQARMAGPLGRVVGGRIWRYELEPTNGSTRVRESWDIRQDRQRWLLRVGPTPRQTRRSMERTLERIEELVSGSGSATPST